MLQQLNDRLTGLKTKLRLKKNWELRVQDLADELRSKKSERDQLAKILEQEQKDVDRLTGISLGAFFYSMIGRRDAKLTQEEEEALQAKLRYEEAADTVTELETEIAELKRQLAEVQHVEADFAAAMDEKKQLLQKLRPDLASELDALTEQEEEAQVNAKELQEAVSAGRAVLSSLNHAEDRLGSAKNWGTYDMLGGGMISTAMKHNRIDEARSAIHDAQNKLRRFQTELKDVQRDINIQIDIGGMLTFADYFFDGLITDWMVQGRIQNTLEQLTFKQSQISQLVSMLETERNKTEQTAQSLRNQRLTMIEDA